VPLPCSICIHPERGEIDRSLARQGGYRKVAQRYGVTPWSLLRHEENHLAAELVKAAEATSIADAINAVEQFKAINAATIGILADARKRGDAELALKAIARVEKQIELQARLLGAISDAPTINILVAPEWLGVRAVLLAALQPYPEARAAVAGALAGTEARNGHG
jgi:hypothetical protein